uniref:Uncharacterized protein n=1 Tax=uncultured Desulfobacterales bacterium HF0200_07G10 TaxID=710741 RepID=E0XU26_9BACT|nr:hypothetical protein [uncultured Desulfobacterales bacterium HF0200_07G10]
MLHTTWLSNIASPALEVTKLFSLQFHNSQKKTPLYTSHNYFSHRTINN